MNGPSAKGADFFTHVVLHELGHAVDVDAYTSARLRVEELKKQIADASKPKPVTIDPNAPLGSESGSDAKKEKEQLDQLKRQLKQAQAVLDKVEQSVDLEKGGVRSQSKEFVKAKGKAISEYGGKTNMEDFAELFSIFVQDPDLLKSLRPDAFKYFSDTLK